MAHSGVSALCVALCVAAVGSLNAQSGWVVIPVKDYDQLRAKVAPPPPPVGGGLPEFDATLTRIEYALRAGEGLANGTAVLTVDVIGDGWAQVPLPAELLVRQARLAATGKPAMLVNGAAVFSSKGRHVVQLEIAVPIVVSGGEERIALPTGGSGITSASLVVERPGLEVTATGGVVAAGASNTWLAHGRGQEPLVLSWRRKMEERREELSLRQRGKLLETISLGEDGTVVWSEVELDVVQGSARRARIEVPASLTVNQVPGANVADWDLKAGVLEVTFLEPVEKQAKFLIHAEARLPRDGAFELPLLHILDVERETGGVAVEAMGSAEIKRAAPKGLERADPAELGALPWPRQPALVESFRFAPGFTAARALSVEVARYTPQAMLTAIVEEARVQVLLSADGKALVRARYAVRNNQRNFLKVTLPAGATPWTSSVAGRPARPGQGPESSLVLPLPKSRSSDDAPATEIEVTYLTKMAAWAERGRVSLALPKLDLPVSRSGVVLFYPPRYRVTAEPGAFLAKEFTPPESSAFSAAAAPVPVERAPQQQQLQQQMANSSNIGLANSQVLVDSFRARRFAAQPAVAPVRMGFPAYGPSLFLAAELTAENKEPTIELTFQQEKDRKGGNDR